MTMKEEPAIVVPWFPKCLDDISNIGLVLMDTGSMEDPNNVQFTDLEYRKRRSCITDISLKFKVGDKI